jgi:hypothetical protein
MKSGHALALLSLTALAVTHAPVASAQGDWIARCRLELADAGKPESGKYLFLTRGKVAGAEARAAMDYASGLSARAAVYPTDAKDLLNPYSTLNMSLGYVVPGDGKASPSIGHVSFGAIGKDFQPIPGAPITLKLVIDGKAFGPYEPKPVSSGMYSVWLDTAATDGDGKPPLLAPDAFKKLADALMAMKTAEVVLVRDGAEIAKGAIPLPQLAAWRDGLAPWAAKTNPNVGAATGCSGGGDVLN